MFSFTTKILVLLLVLIGSIHSAAAVNGPVVMKRACISGNHITVNWHPVVDDCGTHRMTYIFARETPTNNFILIDSIADISVTNYLHMNARPISNRWSYYLVFDTGCNGDVYSDTVLLDIIPPSDIFIDSVSVKDGASEITWGASTSKDVMGYIIYYFDGTNNISIDTLWGSNNTFYRDLIKGNPAGRPESYKVAAFDSCRNLNPISPLHTTIYQTASIDTCKRRINFQWTNYIGWNVGVYNVVMTIGNNRELIYTGTNNSFQYVYDLPLGETTLCFTVEAKSNTTGASSTSNSRCFTVFPTRNADELYLENVSSTEDGNIEIQFTGSGFENVSGFSVKRGKSEIILDSITFITMNGVNDIVWTDVTADIYVKNYYQIVSHDKCFLTKVHSNVSRNIVLNVNSDKILSWNSYINWEKGVYAYQIYKTNTLEGIPFQWNHLADVGSIDSFYTDIIVDTEAGNEGICYKVIAIGIDGEESTSNIACWHGNMVVYIPSAFVVNGVNNVFRPYGVFIDWSKSSMRIMNRWGQFIIDKTGTHDLLWDGTMNNGEQAPPGIYSYILEMHGSDGTVQFFHGKVHKL